MSSWTSFVPLQEGLQDLALPRPYHLAVPASRYPAPFS